MLESIAQILFETRHRAYDSVFSGRDLTYFPHVDSARTTAK